jgi:hypothetical protein
VGARRGRYDFSSFRRSRLLKCFAMIHNATERATSWDVEVYLWLLLITQSVLSFFIALARIVDVRPVVSWLSRLVSSITVSHIQVPVSSVDTNFFEFHSVYCEVHCNTVPSWNHVCRNLVAARKWFQRGIKLEHPQMTQSHNQGFEVQMKTRN